MKALGEKPPVALVRLKESLDGDGDVDGDAGGVGMEA